MTSASNHDLELVTRPTPRTSRLYDVEVPDSWQQGRGAFGGWGLATLVRAIESFARAEGHGEERPLRSLTAELPSAALIGPASVVVEPVRLGKGVSTVAAKLVQGDEVRACATAILAFPRAPAAATFCELTKPVLRPFEEVPKLPTRGIGPVFTQHFEYRSDGPYPFTAGQEALTLGWVRAKHAGEISKAALLVALADAYWPASFSRASGPFPIATVAFTLQVTTNLDRVHLDEPLAYRARTWVQGDGFFVEQRELWTTEGVLAALNQQTFAILA